ncbi:hypothetical protein RBH76_14155 [Oscillospiraceae bacterium MB24-C1]|nr:hypothetical protein RBH76_14155 [Oscillospiraceae bacterium MB24-C1]
MTRSCSPNNVEVDGELEAGGFAVENTEGEPELVDDGLLSEFDDIGFF